MVVMIRMGPWVVVSVACGAAATCQPHPIAVVCSVSADCAPDLACIDGTCIADTAQRGAEGEGEDRFVSLNADSAGPALNDPGLFRLSPPDTCSNGEFGGDRALFLGFKRTTVLRPDRVGDGLASVSVCVR
jgi:hypothetical protein